jgi:hypothetical protein
MAIRPISGKALNFNHRKPAQNYRFIRKRDQKTSVAQPPDNGDALNADEPALVK